MLAWTPNIVFSFEALASGANMVLFMGAPDLTGNFVAIDNDMHRSITKMSTIYSTLTNESNHNHSKLMIITQLIDMF